MQISYGPFEFKYQPRLGDIKRYLTVHVQVSTIITVLKIGSISIIYSKMASRGTKENVTSGGDHVNICSENIIQSIFCLLS